MTYYSQGAYKCEVIDQGLSMSSTEKPQIWLLVRVLQSNDNPDLTINQYERTIFWTLTEKTIDFTLDKLERLGFSGQSFRDVDPNVEGHHSFVGQIIDCWCRLETYEGKEREKWDLSRDLTVTPPDPLGDSDARKLDALFGRKLKERFKKSSAAKPAKAESQPNEPLAVGNVQSAGAPPADDDIPF